MKFSCEACAARYYMDDEKVRHKTLRIRCKKCGNVMTVGDGATTLAEQGSGSNEEVLTPRERLEPTPDSVWFYAAAGQTYGPYSEPELLRRFETGRIAEEVHVWKQGFAAWLPAHQVEAFALAIDAAVPVRQPTQSIDISELNLAPVGARSEQPIALPSSPSQPVVDAEAKARLTALRDGLRKSRGAESGTALRPMDAPPGGLAFEAGGAEVTDLVDGSIADATASLLAKAQSAAAAPATELPPGVEAPEAPAEVPPSIPAARSETRAFQPTPPPVADSAPDHAIAAEPGASSIPRLPVLADAAVLPQGQGIGSASMSSALNAAPTASLMLQVTQSKAANRNRLLLGGGLLALLLGVGLFATRGGNDTAAPAANAPSPKALPPAMALTPEQEALRADRSVNAVESAKQQIRGAIREGASSAVTAIMKKRMAEDAARKKRGMAAVKRTTKVVFDEVTGTIAERDANAPDPAPQATATASTATRARGIGVAIAAPKLGKVSSPAALPANYFNAGLRKVEESIQYCNQRQISAEGPLRKPRVELKLSIMPSGRVTSVELNQEVASTTFAGCMRGRKERWIFGAFEGEPLQIAKTYIVE